MSLRFFHILFIALAAVLAAGMGVWSLNGESLVFGGLSLVAAVALAVYGFWYARKTKGQSLI